METNYALAIMKIYPDAKPSIDFSTCLDVDGKQYISEWNYNQPQPTENELETAWNEYVSNPPQVPLSELEQIKKQQTDLVFQLMMNGVL